MKKLLAFILQLSCIISYAQVKVQNLLTENRIDPIGIDMKQPRFSWQLQTDQRNTMQTAYEIRIGIDKKQGRSSGKILSDQSVHVSYTGDALQSGKKYTWQVRVWDNDGKVSPWSAAASFQMALLNKNDWKAKWISPGFEEDTVNRPVIYFRNHFSATKKIQSATAYITSHGMYEAYINGKRVGDAYLSPGWTSYNKRLQYQVYNVTELLTSGNNAIGVTVANGWYRGYLAWNGNKNVYGSDASLLLQLDITYSDGSNALVISDDSWRSSTGSIQFAEIYHGETIDAREEKAGWTNTTYNDAGWNKVKVGNYPTDILLAAYNEPIKKHETFNAIKIFTTPKGEKVIDFGQNLVGWVMVKARGKAGDKIIIHHAEVLDKAGNFYIENMRVAKETATYILSGKGEESFEPHFTFFGFRYIKINAATEIKPGDFTAVALYSDMKPTGEFASSNPLINQLQHNIQWGQKGNFLDVPTDCPQRDERLGWTGDAQAFSRTASFNFGVNNFFAKWMKDVTADQLPNGSVPFVIPNVLGANAAGATGWADAATIIPWNMYLVYADKKILEEQYPGMKAWVTYMEKASKNDLWNTGFHYGDWLSYMQDNDLMGRSAITDKYLIAQCFFANSVQIMINTAKVLGNNSDVAYYTGLLKRLKDAYLKEYVTANGRLSSNTQTAYVLALNFDMLPENMRQQAVERLVENIKSYNNHLSTGFLGTPYLCHVLSRFGRTDVAYTLLMQETFPSWLYPVKMGATTIWERWNGIHPDSTFEPASMNSFNHYAYGAIGDWMYRVIAGLDTYTDGPGYKHIKIQPHIGNGLTHAEASLETYYGKVSSEWKTEGEKLLMNIEIPANTTATIYIPASKPGAITESEKAITTISDIKISGTENGYAVLLVGSGKYKFQVNGN